MSRQAKHAEDYRTDSQFIVWQVVFIQKQYTYRTEASSIDFHSNRTITSPCVPRYGFFKPTPKDPLGEGLCPEAHRWGRRCNHHESWIKKQHVNHYKNNVQMCYCTFRSNISHLKEISAYTVTAIPGLCRIKHFSMWCLRVRAYMCVYFPMKLQLMIY